MKLIRSFSRLSIRLLLRFSKRLFPRLHRCRLVFTRLHAGSTAVAYARNVSIGRYLKRTNQTSCLCITKHSHYASNLHLVLKMVTKARKSGWLARQCKKCLRYITSQSSWYLHHSVGCAVHNSDQRTQVSTWQQLTKQNNLYTETRILVSPAPKATCSTQRT
jgi:hypothetical protein